MAFPLGAAFAVFMAAGTPSAANAATPDMQQVQNVPVIAPAAVKAMLAGRERVLVVDVREANEFAAGHIAGATLMPLSTLANDYSKLPKDVALVVYCRSGHRSAKAVAFLQAHGYGKAVSMDGGYIAWSQLP
ncbi:rhodanese-related sulfurtransferase [Rhizomicrobium palustre]|uniref:Rhodanese-related sulfurtransferase n=1 Tax=Rhizomicrobium palustre TaxID=189966 RepID=A0A846MWC3_9PROT|nr:rhodanese-like domain-containing protein [Rhizomicrobium palustre]NIK87696.1 rhodanese-related sulfurtransferase [Rhizomicrobium palustre]